ncbi:MAG: hypothetical protein LC104_09695 [Bacteroidales bacterium]|nr:hypothetical protein [Bacteroidales bacterium]
MRIRMEACPDGVAVIIPKTVAICAGLRGGETAEVEATAGRLVVRPVLLTTLADMLGRITPENLHTEWATGAPSGVELL